MKVMLNTCGDSIHRKKNKKKTTGGLSRGKSCLSLSEAQKLCWIFLGSGSGIYNQARTVVGLVPTCGSTLIPICVFCVCVFVWVWLMSVGPECFKQRKHLLTPVSYWVICGDCQLAGRPGWAVFLSVLRATLHPQPLPAAPNNLLTSY